LLLASDIFIWFLIYWRFIIKLVEHLHVSICLWEKINENTEIRYDSNLNTERVLISNKFFRLLIDQLLRKWTLKCWYIMTWMVRKQDDIVGTSLSHYTSLFYSNIDFFHAHQIFQNCWSKKFIISVVIVIILKQQYVYEFIWFHNYSEYNT